MRNLTRSAIILALSISCGHLCLLLAQSTFPSIPQTDTSRKAAGATVLGRVTVQGKGKGGIVVGVVGRDFGQPSVPSLKDVTDLDGNYQITDIPAGTYQVLPLSPGYAVSDVTSFSGPGKALILTEGERASNVDFSLTRGAVITGKVTHADGRPVIEESIYLVGADQNNQGGPRYGAVSSSQTDDRGIYRMFGLRAGRYKVCVGAPEEGFVPNRNRPTFQRVFYPSVSEFDEAKVVEVGEGSEATNIDITVGQTTKGFAVSGSIVDGERNQPILSMRVGLQKIAEGNYAPFVGTAMTNERGEFRMENVSPGKYSVFVMPQPNSDTQIDPVRLEIVDQDVTGLTLKTSKGAVVSGTVVIEGNPDKKLYERLAKLRLYAYVRGEQGTASMAGSRTTTIGPDGSFRLGGLLPGAAVFNLPSDPRSPSGFVISRIERDGVIQPRSGMEIKALEEVAGIKILVVYGTGTIRGSVKWDNELPPEGARLMVRLSRPADNSFSIRPEEVDARGRFVFQGVPAGDYEITLSSIVRVSSGSPSVRQPVTVTDGAATEVELVVNTGAKTSPTP